MDSPNQDLPSDAIAALESGSKIDAIKCVRVARGVGLKDAKEIVESFLDTRPDIQSRMATANAGKAKSSLGWLLFLGAIGFAAYYFLNS